MGHPDKLRPYKNDRSRTRSNSRSNYGTSRSASRTQSANRSSQKDLQPIKANCHLAQYTEYKDPSETSLFEEETFPFQPDLHYINHQTNNFDDIDYSTSQDHAISDTHNYADDFF